MFIKLLLCMFISLVNASSWITWINPWAEPTPKKVCYGDLGCFSNEYPFSNANEYLPQDPTKIGLELLLFTRQNRYMPNNFTGGIGNYFKRDKSIKVIVHGYYSKATTEWVIEMKDAFLQKEDCNVVLLDWSKAAFSYYNQAVADTRVAGALAAMYINNTMNHYKVKSSEIHIVGFSLGAHIAGYIGSSIKGLGRITGLDPAGPDFESTDPEVRLDPSDARFVDVIHTDSDHILNIELSPGFGTSQPMGHVDFYVNGGKNQPGCPTYGHQTSAEYILSNMYSAFGKTYDMYACCFCGYNKYVNTKVDISVSALVFPGQVRNCNTGTLSKETCDPKLYHGGRFKWRITQRKPTTSGKPYHVRLQVEYTFFITKQGENHNIEVYDRLDDFTESIKSNCTFTSYPCESYIKFTNGECLSCGDVPCPSMGLNADKYERKTRKPRGRYYLDTGESSPYCAYTHQVEVHLGSKMEVIGGRLDVTIVGENGNSEKYSIYRSHFIPGYIHQDLVLSPDSKFKTAKVQFYENTIIPIWLMRPRDYGYIAINKVTIKDGRTLTTVDLCVPWWYVYTISTATITVSTSNC